MGKLGRITEIPAHREWWCTGVNVFLALHRYDDYRVIRINLAESAGNTATLTEEDWEELKKFVDEEFANVEK